MDRQRPRPPAQRKDQPYNVRTRSMRDDDDWGAPEEHRLTHDGAHHHPREGSLTPPDVSGRAGRDLRPKQPGKAKDATDRGKRARWWQTLSLRSLQTRRYSMRAVAVLAVLSVLVGFCATQGALNTFDAINAVRNAKVEVTAIEAILKGGNFLDTQTLEDLQLRFETLSVDMERIQAAIPGESVLANTPGANGPIHVIRMASDLVNAGQYGVAAALILVPRFKGMLTTLGSGHSATPGATTTTTAGATPSPTVGPPGAGALTLNDLNQAIGDINISVNLVQQAVAERAGFTDKDLSRVGLSSLLPTIHKLDPLLPQLPQLAAAAQGLANALPSLLGFDATRRYLLIEMDSDELRATGGFQGNYGILTFTNGQLVSGIQLHDVRATLDCPNGACPNRPVPQPYTNWFTIAPNKFGLRDANLDPNFPASAQIDESLYNIETNGQTVDGVIAVTPAVIEQILTLTGPLTVTIPDTQPAKIVSVNAQNLQDEIHYYHFTNGGGGGNNTIVNDLGTSSQKAIDAVLGSNLLSAVSHLSALKQKGLTHILQQGMLAHDIQMYFNNAAAEHALLTFKLGSALQSPSNTDTLMVDDTNIGGTYANQDVTEHIADTITLDAQGNATHNLTITYAYPVKPHLYSQVVVNGQVYYWAGWYYRDYVRVIAPQRASSMSDQGCNTNTPTTENNFQVLGCGYEIDRDGVNYPTSKTLQFTWTVPAAAVRQGSGWQYHLLLQRQAGAHDTVVITIIVPKGDHFISPPTAPLKATGATGATTAQASASLALVTDQTFTVQYG